MGVYISMEMPTHCIDCPFMVSRDGDDCILQSIEANANFENWEQMKADCPLVPVPPHGDLIDRDALMKLEVVPSDNWVFRAIEIAPTIIPADPAEEGET